MVSGAFRVLVTCTRQSVVFFLKNRLMSGKSNCSVAILTQGTHTESLFVQGYKMLSKVRGITVPFYVQTCMRAYVRTYTRTHARKHTHTPMYVRAYVRTYLPTNKLRKNSETDRQTDVCLEFTDWSFTFQKQNKK